MNVITAGITAQGDHSKMTIFTINEDQNITAHASAEQAAAVGGDRFKTTAELAKLASSWPADRLVGIWNSLPGVIPVKKFKDRNTAVTRIWKAIQGLAEAALTAAQLRNAPALAAPQAKRSSTAATATEDANTARDGSKKAQILALLRRPHGATLAEIMVATGWQAHSVRGFISGSLGKKMGLSVASAKREDGERVYQLKQ